MVQYEIDGKDKVNFALSFFSISGKIVHEVKSL